MKNLMLALSLSFAAMALSAPTHAKNAACETQATETKLAGAAKASFVKKCGKDAAAGNAQASCDAKAADKKLAGAAKTSFTKKCVADAAK